MDVVLHVNALRTAAGKRVALPPAAREIPEAGTAVAVHEAGHHPESVYVRRSTLEDVFLILTGRSLED